jgi:hypothetical protein
VDENEQALVDISSTDLEDVETLYDYVRRKALDVDRIIDEILKSEE